MPGGHMRSVSRVFTNRNSSWVGMSGAWFFFILVLATAWFVISAFFDAGVAWTIVNVGHAVFTFYFFHWVKGSPISDDQGKYDKQTFWEQIDDGMQNTNNRKFFTLVPVVLYILAAHTSKDNLDVFILNTVCSAVVVIAKLPLMHNVRLFGINRD